MEEEHGGLCAICQTEPELLVIDHDHDTGQVRGLLCRACNLALGFFRDDTSRLDAAKEYLTSRAIAPHPRPIQG